MQDKAGNLRASALWPLVQMGVLHFGVLLAVAFLLLCFPRPAQAVYAVKCYSSGTSSTPGWPSHFTPGFCDWTWYDDGGGGSGHAAGPDGNIGPRGGGAVHTSANKASAAQKKNDPNPCPGRKGDPVILSSGAKVETITDFAQPGEMGLTFERYYNSRFSCVGTNSPCSASVGTWTTNLDYKLDVICYYQSTGGNPDRPIRCGPVVFTRPDGSSLSFQSTTAFFGTTGGAPVPGPFTAAGTATLTDNGNGTYTLRDEDAQALTFDNQGNLLSIKDPSGIGWTLTHPDGNTTIVTHTNGTSFKVALVAGSGGTYGSAKQINVTDPAGGVYVYQSTVGVWDSFTNPVSHIGVVSSETLPGSPSTTVSYKYLPDNAVTGSYGQLTEVDYNGVAHDVTTYDSAGRANMTSLADGSEKTSMVYGSNATGPTVTVTSPLNHVSVYQFNSAGLLVSIAGQASEGCAATYASNAYDTNGFMQSSTDNNGNVTQYTYDASGLLQKKVEASGAPVQRTTDYVWDTVPGTDRLLSVTVEGWSKTAYTYDAQNLMASEVVTDLSRGANQSLATTYTRTLYGNGLVNTLTVTSPSGSNAEVVTYDTLGRVTSVADGLGHTTTYGNYNGLGEAGHVVGPNGDVTDVAYDARGRVQTRTTYPNGAAATWAYGYDGFGLPASELTPAGETISWNRDAEMRVINVVRNDKDGTSTESFGYDANGDVTSHAVSRNGSTSLSQTLVYDALGRVYQRLGTHGQKVTYGYDGNGNVVSVTDAAGHTVSNEYDALNRLIRTTSSGGASPPIPGVAPTLSAPANSSNGSYSVSWSTVSGTTNYMLQEQVNGSGWSTAQTGGSTSFALSSQASGTYGYRVIACNVTGCSPWSSIATVYVTQITGNIEGVPIDGSGNASVVGWACSTGLAQSITVDLYVGGPYGTGTFIGSYTANQGSEPAVASACHVSSGSYRYSIPLSTTVRSQYVGQTIYIYGISPIGSDNLLLNNSGSFIVPVNEPAGAPTLSVPAANGTGSYTVSWSAVTGATSYTLQEQVNSGAWATVQNSAGTSWATSGKSNGSYGYRVQACNSSGCNTWSNVASVTVLLPPAAPASISVPATSSGSFTVTWSASATATSYTLQQSVNGGGWTTVYNSAANGTALNEATTGSYTLRAQACNGGGCSAYTTSNPVAVTIPPASAPGLSVPANSSNGSYTVSWTGVSGATSYPLQERVNGGGWTTVQNNGSTSWGAGGKGNGTYGYQVQACNAGGCGPWSGTNTITVTLIPATPAGLTATIEMTNLSGNALSASIGSVTPQARGYAYNLSASWAASSGASSYTFQYCKSGGTCATHTGSTTSVAPFAVTGTAYTVSVQACNASGCSAYSASVTPTIVQD
jgi:YD repeat-containing protein